MSKYTTGEIAKLCGVSVRTVQYYDSRNILVPSELSEGGRRLYSEQDLKRMKIICFLRDAGISINSIGQLLSEEDPGSVISILLDQQEQLLLDEMQERKSKLEIIEGIRRELKNVENFSVESIGDIAYTMENKKKMRQLHAILLITGLPLSIFQWGGNHPVGINRDLVALCGMGSCRPPLWDLAVCLLFQAGGIYLPPMPRSL